MAPVVKNLPANAGDIETWVQSLGWEDPLEEGMATHSSILAWRIPANWGPEACPLIPAPLSLIPLFHVLAAVFLDASFIGKSYLPFMMPPTK